MVGLGLACTVVLEAHQKLAMSPVPARAVTAPVAEALASAPTAPIAPAPSSVVPAAKELRPSEPMGSPMHSLAINSGIPAQRPAQINPDQVAFRPWGRASFPVENFQSYTSPFGYRISPTGGYSREFHYGLDLAAPMGSYIRNWWTGTVAEVSDNTNCGTSVIVESGNWRHIYCHMQGRVQSTAEGKFMIDREGGIQIWQGQQIQAGQRIGRVGMTGRTTGPHLHWGLKYSQNWVDPALVLRAMYAEQRNALNPNQ